MRLFKEQGFEATTVEQIAAAVEISPSTFFNYFPSKEDVLFTDPYDDLFIAILQRRPPGETVWEAIRGTVRTVMEAAVREDLELMLFRTRLALETPDLRGRFLDELRTGADRFRKTVARWAGIDPEDFQLRVVTEAVVAGLTAAAAEWIREDGRPDLVLLVEKALDVLEAGDRLEVLGARPRENSTVQRRRAVRAR